jgi:hypothetical protein
MTDDDIQFDDLDAAESLLSAVESNEAQGRGRFVASTLGQVAEFFGLALQTVKEWRLASPPMPGEPGNYPLPEIVRWRLSRLKNNELTDELRRADLEKTQCQVEAARIALDEKKANILDRADVELWAAVALTEVREGVMQLPEMLAASAPEQLKAFVREESDRHCRDLLNATARRLELAEIGKGGTDDQP